MYKHILLATELDDESRYVEKQAAAIQKLTGAKLSIIHIIEPLASVYAVGEIGVNYNYAEDSQAFVANAKKLLQPARERLGVSPSNMIIKIGSVSKEILHYADKNNIDLIITGSHGRHGLQLLLGSTANAILHGAHCDVLAVRLIP